MRISVDPESGFPIYLQLVEQVKRGVALGTLQPGEQLPTVKQMASDLVVNASTVVRAMRELEHLGLIQSLQGRGSFVASNGAQTAARKASKTNVRGALESAVRDARSLGINGREARELFEQAYSKWYSAEKERP